MILSKEVNLKGCLLYDSAYYSLPGFTLGVVHSMGLHKCIVVCVHHYSITESSFTPKNPLCSAHSSFHSPQSLQSLVFTLFVILPFPECHLVGII